jgi:hypothetical protein
LHSSDGSQAGSRQGRLLQEEAMTDPGRWSLMGVLLIVAGGIVLLMNRLGVPLGLGRLPGDIAVEREGFRFYFPITTSILISIAVSLILYLLRR